MTKRKQYRLDQEDIDVLKQAQSTYRYRTETDSLRAGLELLRKYMQFQDTGLTLVVVCDEEIQECRLSGLRLITQ